ncbi:MAG: FKBP-type peptidyl-prolyl cis-trans isomerase [Bacteroidetes bacterium]|nr:FKBP-type peptidyl-prolyl cis-trans isomerase [Bacteroidota bacterium]
MKKTFFKLLALVMIVAVAGSCTSKYPGFKKSDSGLYYKLYSVSKDTVKPKLKDWIAMEYKLVVKSKGKDSTFIDSRKSQQGPLRMQLPPSDYKGDIYEGMRMLAAGDSGEFIVNADSLFRKTFRQGARPPYIDSNSVATFFIHMVSVSSPEAMQKKEKETLAKFIADNKITVTPKASGLYYIPETEGKGVKIDSGCQVVYNVKISTIEGKQVFAQDSMKFVFGKRPDMRGFVEGIQLMTKGGKARLILPSELAFGERGYREIPPYTSIIYDIKVLDVKSKADYSKIEAAEKKKQEAEKKKQDEKKAGAKKAEAGLRQKYLKDHKITATPTASGLYYIETAKGTGPKVKAGSKVSVHYTGTLLDGKKFDSSRDHGGKPFELEVGKGNVIKGWDEGLQLMSKGGKAILIVPSSIGYGAQDMGSIPAYSTLVFDIEVLDVK